MSDKTDKRERNSRPRKGQGGSPVRTRYQPDHSTVGLAARRVAVEILGRVVTGRRPLDDELKETGGHSGFAALIARDRGLVRAMLGTALRRRGQISAIIDRLLERPVPEKTGFVLDILHVAAAQVLFMEVPDRAAVAIAVALADADNRSRRYKGLVNAVLRRMVAEREELLATTEQPWRNAPVWLFAGWQKAYGEETALALAEMHLLEPNLDLSVKVDPKGWAERLGGTAIGGNTVRLARPGGRIEALEGYDAGAWWVQDAAAAIPARLLGDVAGLRVADLCAAPGGKTAQLAAAGGHVTAIDISARRLERLSQNLARLSLAAEVVAADLAEYEPAEPFDAVLLDAPCSATGTIRRHPEVAWNRRAEDVASLAATQALLLERVSGWLKPGGRLVYCTCSLEPAEGELVVARFLAANPDFARLPITDGETGFAGLVTAEGDLRTLPVSLPREPRQDGGMDGFFAARLVRR